jgi:dTDP-4-dehydrorhamnose reductase
MLGHAIVARLQALGQRFVATDANLDIGDREPVLAFARSERPSAIVNAAAYTRVDDAENEAALAFRVNADGPAFLAEAAQELGAPLLHFSTDYVFDGSGVVPYTEQAITSPLGTYGRSKREGEARVLERCSSGAYLVRTSWLFGENGNNFVKTMARLMRERDELSVVADQHGRPTYTRDLADAALRLLGFGSTSAAAPSLYHFANSGPTTWFDFSAAIRSTCVSCGLQLRVKTLRPITTAEFPRPAPRPPYSVLDTSRIEAALGEKPRPWESALSDYVAGQVSDWKSS